MWCARHAHLVLGSPPGCAPRTGRSLRRVFSSWTRSGGPPRTSRAHSRTRCERLPPPREALPRIVPREASGDRRRRRRTAGRSRRRRSSATCSKDIGPPLEDATRCDPCCGPCSSRPSLLQSTSPPHRRSAKRRLRLPSSRRRHRRARATRSSEPSGTPRHLRPAGAVPRRPHRWPSLDCTRRRSPMLAPQLSPSLRAAPPRAARRPPRRPRRRGRRPRHLSFGHGGLRRGGL